MKKKILSFIIIFLCFILKVNAGELTITSIASETVGVYGDAVLLESDGKYLLMDGFHDVNNSNFITKYLKDKKINKLSLYLSHYHVDHFRGLEEILKDTYFTIEKVYLPITAYSDGVTTEVENLAKERNITQIYLEKGSTFTFGDANFNIIGPFPINPIVDKNNNYSLVAMITVDDVKFLSGGDIQEQQEQAILNSGIDIKADIFKLTHHGNHYIDSSNKRWFSNTANYVNKVNPKFTFYQYTYSIDNFNDRPWLGYETKGINGNVASIPNDTKNAYEFNYNVSSNVASMYNGDVTIKIEDNVITQELEKNNYTYNLTYYDYDTGQQLDEKKIDFSKRYNIIFNIDDYKDVIPGYHYKTKEEFTNSDGNSKDIWITVEKDVEEPYFNLDSSLLIIKPENIIYNLELKNTIDHLLEKIDTNGDIKILKDNTEITSGIIKTGYQIKVTLSDRTEEYILSVKGDISGDGISDITDVIQVSKYIINRNNQEFTVSEKAKRKAGDMNGDNKIDITDAVQLSKSILQK